MEFQHVDVFADSPFTGNSLTVFLADSTVTTGQMLSITREFRHFESIFLWPTADDSRWRARVFDLADELDFAGHPVYGPSVTGAAVAPVLDGIGLCDTDLVPGLEPAVVSTGLRYLVIPVRATALARAAITVADFAGRLAAVGAQFAYLLDPDGPEGRHWTNDGGTEDIATGSAAGTVGAYLARAGRIALNQPFTLHQGRFAGRPSQIQVEARGSAGEVARILVGGHVALVATGTLRNLPG